MNVYEEVERFYGRFRGEKCVYGKSAEGRDLYAVFVGRHEAPLGISQYAIHGREFVTALLALVHAERGVGRGGVWILPMTNPDGCLIAEEGLSSVSAARREKLRPLCGDHSFWKANAEGVDLNVNFDANWGTGAKNTTDPASENYIGAYPCCAPESRALRDFTLAVRPGFTVSWHTKGEEIYYRFFQPPRRAARDKRLADLLANSTGYPLRDAPDSAGGYKDWCVQTLQIPAFTVECGRETRRHPLGREELHDLTRKCGNALRDFAEGY